jgi:hypothetical protein
MMQTMAMPGMPGTTTHTFVLDSVQPCVFQSKTASHSNSNPPLIPVKIRHMKQPLHLAVECLMVAKELPVELADRDGSRSA